MHIKPIIRLTLTLLLVLPVAITHAQLGSQQKTFTRADTLRGSITAERAWWDVTWYGIDITPDYNGRSLTGTVTLNFRVLSSGSRMQIDLQQPMQINKVTQGDKSLSFKRDGNVYYIDFPSPPAQGQVETIVMQFSGKPVVAV